MVGNWYVKLARRGQAKKPDLSTDFSQAVHFASSFAKFLAYHYACENRIFALYIGFPIAFTTRFR